MELRKVSQEKEKAQTENDKLMYDLERVATQNNKSQAALEKSQEEVARLQVSRRSTSQRPGQGHDNRATPRLALCSRQNFLSALLLCAGTIRGFWSGYKPL